MLTGGSVDELVAGELRLAEKAFRVHAFGSQFLRVVNLVQKITLLILKQVRAGLAETVSNARPDDAEAVIEAFASRKEFKIEVERVLSARESISREIQAGPSSQLKSDFERFLRSGHPVFSEEKAERSRRYELLRHAHSLFREGNTAAIAELVDEDTANEESLSIPDENLRKRLRHRMAELEKERKALEETEFCRLYERALMLKEQEGKDLLQDVTERLATLAHKWEKLR